MTMHHWFPKAMSEPPPAPPAPHAAIQLTDEEREAIEVAAEAYVADHGERFAATLRSLLERLK
jgi:hypothetical protein